MANIPMWWAGSSITDPVPLGVTASFAPGGISITGGVNGPPSGFLSLGESFLSFGVFSAFWLHPDNIPSGVGLVDSTPLAIMSGELQGFTAGGIWPFGPWPITTCDLIMIQRVASGGAPIASRTLSVSLLSIVEREFVLDNIPMPSPLALPTIQFNLPTTPNLSIGTSLIFTLRFRGDGRIAFSQFVTSPPFVIGVPQWNLVSVP